MLILFLIDVQYSQKAVFSFEKEKHRQNHSSIGFLQPVKKIRLVKISNSPTPYRYLKNLDENQFYIHSLKNITFPEG